MSLCFELLISSFNASDGQKGQSIVWCVVMISFGLDVGFGLKNKTHEREREFEKKGYGGSRSRDVCVSLRA